MTTGRTLDYWTRVYIDGYDLSGYMRKLGDLKQEFASAPDASFTDGVKNITAVGQATLGIGTLNGFFDNTATLGLHVVAQGAGIRRVVMIAKGIRAAPAQGDPVYAGEFEQLGYQSQNDGGNIVASIPFGDADAVAAAIDYAKPWGMLLHAYGAETAVNTAIGVDDYGASPPSLGGFMCYQLFAANGTAVTLKVQEADTNLSGSFGDLSGATSGPLDASVTPKAGIVALARTAAIKRYLRWQIVLAGGATSATFALSFCRATF